jgi:hypothetical protein
MPRCPRKRQPKKRTHNQDIHLDHTRKLRHPSIQDAQSALRRSSTRNKENVPLQKLQNDNRKLTESVAQLENNVVTLQTKAEVGEKKLCNERRKRIRLQSSLDMRKLDVKHMRAENSSLRGEVAALGKEARQIRTTAEETAQIHHTHIKNLQNTIQALRNSQRAHRKHARRLKAAMTALQKRTKEKSKTHPTIFRMTTKGVYTSKARGLARLMVSTGMAESKVGITLQEIGEILGVKVDRTMSARTVGRTILEAGTAADIQMAYEMAQTDSKGSIFKSKCTTHLAL